MNDITAEQREKLMADLRLVITDAEELLKASAGQAGEGMAEMRNRIQARLSLAKERLHDLQTAAVERAKAAGRATDAYVHENPWQSIGIAAGVGFLLGLVIGRR